MLYKFECGVISLNNSKVFTAKFNKFCFLWYSLSISDKYHQDNIQQNDMSLLKLIMNQINENKQR